MPESALARVRIVLVEPAGALNVGSIARVMKNMGLQRLVLVNPHCDPLGAEARQMAVHGDDILSTALRVNTLPEALQGCQRAIATTARDRALETPLDPPRLGLPWLLELLPDRPSVALNSALIFGPEDRGLSNVELSYAQRFVRIPSSPVYPSLNLAQAVAICCYELYLAALEGSKPPSATPPLDLAPIEVLEQSYQQLESVLLKIGYLYPHTAASRMEKFRRLFNRSQLSVSEVALLRGILGQVEWLWQTQQAAAPDRTEPGDLRS